jgi:hypothetical protein
MEQAGRILGKPIPVWWNFLWQQARSLALQFSDQLEAFRSQFSFAATEYAFRDLNVTPALKEFFVSGRWDILLCDKISNGDGSKPLIGSSILVVDYKTGTNLKMSASSQDGIQLALYSHAALAWGAERVDTAWISPHTSGGLIHLPFEELEKWEPLVADLGRLIRCGTFGMRGELRSEFSFSSAMPLATLPIPPDILESKWQLTHTLGEPYQPAVKNRN